MPEIIFFPTDLTLGQKVRVGRVGRRWRQADMAAYAGVAQTSVSALERGLNIYPLAEKRILSTLGLIPDGIEHYKKLISAYTATPVLKVYFERRLRLLSDGEERETLRSD